jgi:hypothetical protein
LWLRRTVSLDPSATTINEVADDTNDLRPQCAAVCRGDDVVEALRIEAVAAIKIDTEGAELEVMRGLADTIGRFRPFVICEILPVGDVTHPAGRARLARQRAVQALLTDRDYVLFRLHADGALEQVADIGIHDDLALTNYLAVPASARNAVDAAFIVRAA